MWSLLGGGARREALRLERDARRIIEQTVYGLPRRRVLACARRCARELEQARAAAAVLPVATLRRRLEARHREARRLGEQDALTALTLALIDLRAAALDPPASAASAAIDAFLAEWAGGEGEPPDR